MTLRGEPAAGRWRLTRAVPRFGGRGTVVQEKINVYNHLNWCLSWPVFLWQYEDQRTGVDSRATAMTNDGEF